jgi:hypothetical protein
MIHRIQIPQGVPHPDANSPLSPQTPADYILYLALPLLILIGFFLWRKWKKDGERD